MKALALSIGLTPLLLTTQVQATSVAVPIANAQPTGLASSAKNRGLSAESAIRLKSEVSQKLAQLFAANVKLEKALARMQKAIDDGEHIEISQTVINSAHAVIGSAESNIDVAKDAFDKILSADRLACRTSLEKLRDETMNGLIATIETMKKIPEFGKQIEQREHTVVVIDSSRMDIALNSGRIDMKPGMTREEKRQFILSHAS
ncbi:hypothetical protein MZT64_001425 [Serratia marcescens]|uniref:hypothetical protein n=1 Tax=Serratia ureilytica TaxID=300181 RepID=UPI0018D664F0|nr:hypothetical protein [Serratia ureilytica]EIT7187704.1 hypothetical protein [Serratia marcescens]EJC6391913.1 hypothetical protein [Serratia marcescens]MBH2557191.1 hypothetical protein [Serratia ureilytica]